MSGAVLTLVYLTVSRYLSRTITINRVEEDIAIMFVTSEFLCLSSVFPVWICYIDLSCEPSHPFLHAIILTTLSSSLLLSFLTSPSFCLHYIVSNALSVALSLSLSLLFPHHFRSISVFSSSFHVFAAISSPYLEPDILSLLMTVRRTTGRLLPEIAWSPKNHTYTQKKIFTCVRLDTWKRDFGMLSVRSCDHKEALASHPNPLCFVQNNY